jgi:hypothetical protein
MHEAIPRYKAIPVLVALYYSTYLKLYNTYLSKTQKIALLEALVPLSL